MKNVATINRCAITIRQVRLRRSREEKYSCSCCLDIVHDLPVYLIGGAWVKLW